LGVAEGGGFGFAEGAEFAGTSLNDGAGNFVRKRGGFSAGALGKRENVEIGEGETLDKGERGGVVVFRFAWETGNYIGADGGVRETLLDEFDAACVVLRAIPTVHGGEDTVRGGLQGHVEVLGDAIRSREEIDEILGNVERLDGANAEAFDGGFVKDAAEEVVEFSARRKVAAVGAKVNAAENDFAIAGFGEPLDFPNDFAGRQAAALAADERDDTVRAAGVAAVLDFEGGPGVIPFSTKDRGGEKFGAVEDAASKDVAKRGRNWLRPYEGMERDG